MGCRGALQARLLSSVRAGSTEGTQRAAQSVTLPKKAAMVEVMAMVQMPEASLETLTLRCGPQAVCRRSRLGFRQTMVGDTSTASAQSQQTPWISPRNASSRCRCASSETHNGFRMAATIVHAEQSRLCVQTLALSQLVPSGPRFQFPLVVAPVGVPTQANPIAQAWAHSFLHLLRVQKVSTLCHGTSSTRSTFPVSCLPATMSLDSVMIANRPLRYGSSAVTCAL